MGYPKAPDGVRNIMERLGLIATHRYLTQALYSWASKLFRGDNSIILPRIADADAANNSLYYSTDAGKPVFKDDLGVVNDLY